MLQEVFSSPVQRGTEFDRRFLNTLSRHAEMGALAQLVYIYSLGAGEPEIPYPKAKGRTIYIGETKRRTGAGLRFRGHISTSLTEGLSTLINHTVSVYYHMGRALHLRVLKVTDGRTTKEAERVLLRAHLHMFGSSPLGQGGTGKDNTPCEVARQFLADHDIHTECADLLGRLS
jgi:hypothetical protein